MKIHVVHTTDYQYSASVSQSVNRVCLLPRQTDYQTPHEKQLEIFPAPTQMDTIEDVFGNEVSYFNIDEPHQRFTVTVRSTLTTQDHAAPLPTAPSVDEICSKQLYNTTNPELMAIDCLLPSAYVPSILEVDAVIDQLSEYRGDALAFAQALMTLIYTDYEYDPNFSTLVTPISDVLQAKRGVCQDFAHLAIAVLRRAGIPARYVSGYLETLPPPGQQKLQGADASHAWFSVYIPSLGWYDFDPTNDKRPDGQYVTTAWGRDYADIAPLKGVIYGGGTPQLRVSVDVNRVAPEDY